MELLSPLIFLLFGSVAFTSVARRFGTDELQVLRWSFVMHAVFSVLHVYVTREVLGGGDMFWYHRDGQRLAQLWLSDPGQWTGELLRLTSRQEADFPFWVHGSGGGTATGAMFGVSAGLMLITGGSLFGATMLLSLLNFFSRLAIYSVVRRYVTGRPRRYASYALLLFPSPVFWTAGLLKEAVAMAAIGYAILGVYHIAERSDWRRGLPLVLIGSLPVYLVKPYVLYPLAIAFPVWFIAARTLRASNADRIMMTPSRVVSVAILAAGGLTLLAILAPAYSVELISDELLQVQAAGTSVTGRTGYQLVDSAAAERGLAGQMAYAPIALVFALTRPWFFEVRSIQTAIGALEMTYLVVLIYRAARQSGLRGLFRGLMRSPFLIFCVTYVIVFGTAVGLGSTNVGSLSRYRVPMMGLFVVTIVLLPYYARTPRHRPATVPSVAASAVPQRPLRPWQRQSRRLPSWRQRT